MTQRSQSTMPLGGVIDIFVLVAFICAMSVAFGLCVFGHEFLGMSIFLASVIVGLFLSWLRKRKLRTNIQARGRRYQAKIVDYEADYSVIVHNKPVLCDIVVGFYKDGQPYFCLVDVNTFSKDKYFIGATVDVYEYDERVYIGSEPYSDSIAGESELMSLYTPVDSMVEIAGSDGVYEYRERYVEGVPVRADELNTLRF